MKSNILIIISVIFAIATFNSCKKDEETKPNEIKYDGSSYDLTKGYMLKYGDYGGQAEYYNFDIWLVNDGITITQDDIVGTGDIIYLELWSTSPTGLNPGTYTFANNFGAQTFSSGAVAFNFNVATELGTFYECTGGTVTISQSGADHIFDITFTLASGKTVTAYYKGSIINYDQTSNKSSKNHFEK